MFYFSLAPYYSFLLIWTGFFIYISPGLLDKVNGIQSYQFMLFALYTVMFLIYPILYVCVAMPTVSKNETQDSESISNSHGQLFDPNSQAALLSIFLPIMITLSIHLLCIFFTFLCKCEKKAEFFLVSLLLTIVSLELYSKEIQHNPVSESTSPSIIALTLLIGAWISLYLLLFKTDEN